MSGTSFCGHFDGRCVGCNVLRASAQHSFSVVSGLYRFRRAGMLTGNGSIDGHTAQGLRWFARQSCEPIRTPCRRYPESIGCPAGSGRPNRRPAIGCESSSGWRSTHGSCCGLPAPVSQPHHPAAESSGAFREHLASRLAHALRFQRTARMRRIRRHRRLCAFSCRRLRCLRNRRQTSPQSRSVHEVAHV